MSADDLSPTLRLDPAEAVTTVANAVQHQVLEVLRRRGAVVAISGGVDSAVTAALVARALGPKRVLGLLMPARDSDAETVPLAKLVAEQLGIPWILEDITPVLEACGFYRRRDEAVRRVVPEFSDAWKFKIVLPGDRLESDRLNVFFLVVQSPQGATQRIRLPASAYLEIVAAANFQQRARKMLEYYHADRLHYAVAGTPNRLEYDQGFFVKGGDGLADLKPIAHLYKSQVYQLARHLGLPERILSRPPTTDTYSMPQTQEEFFFGLATQTLDQILFAHNAGQDAEAAATRLGLSPDQVRRAYLDIEQKRATTRYLHLAPLLVEPIRPREGGADPAGKPGEPRA